MVRLAICRWHACNESLGVKDRHRGRERERERTTELLDPPNAKQTANQRVCLDTGSPLGPVKEEGERERAVCGGGGGGGAGWGCSTRRDPLRLKQASKTGGRASRCTEVCNTDYSVLDVNEGMWQKLDFLRAWLGRYRPS